MKALRRPRALLLDLDGTLADTMPDLARAVNHVRARLGWGAMPEGAMRAHLGDGAADLLRGCTGLGAADVEALMPGWREYYGAHCVDTTRLLPGARELLDAAKAAGVSLALLTNKPEAPSRRILEGLGIADLVPVLVGGDTTPHRKPHRAMVDEVLLRLGGVAPKDAWLVGDGLQDVGAAAAAGCVAVLVRGYGDLVRARAAGPHVEVPDLDAVRALLERSLVAGGAGS
jgi:phosphoglycolate phosphatase